MQRHHKDLDVELVEIESEGDRFQGDIGEAGGKNLFVNSLREAIKDGQADCACHSLKDVGLDTGGFLLAAMLPRADPRDALVGKDLSELSKMASPTVATSSPRRAGQLSCALRHARAVAIRGNVDTRLQKLDSGVADALLLACAGLDRLGHGDLVCERLDPGRFVPAPGQGTVVVECLADDEKTASMLSAADDSRARAMATAERSCAAKVGADCEAPFGAHARLSDDGKITVKCSLSLRGSEATGTASGWDAAKVGEVAAEQMISAGGSEIDWRSV